MVHNRRWDQDAVADVIAKEMAYTTRRALVDGQHSVVVVVIIVVVAVIVNNGGGDNHQRPEGFLWHQGGGGTGHDL